MSSSCSFRITRTAEDLAETISAISQRLIKLEQKQEAIELRLNQITHNQPNEEEQKVLDGVEKILSDCKELLDSSTQPFLVDNENQLNLNESDQNLAA